MELNSSKWLIIDTSMQKWFVAILDNGDLTYFHEDTKPVLENLFDCLQEGLSAAKITVKELKEIIYCDGPGSALGIRLACLFRRTLEILPEGKNIAFLTYNSMYWAQILLRSKISTPFCLAAHAGLNDAFILDVSVPTEFSPIKKISRKELSVDVPNLYWLPHMCSDGMAIDYHFDKDLFLDSRISDQIWK